MKKLNVIFSIYTLVALIVVLERLSPTNHIYLSPYNFIGLHEINQTLIFLLATVVVAFLVLRLITNNFETIRGTKNLFLTLLFVIGTYLYGVGEGWHEIVGYIMNSQCLPNQNLSILCHSLFINYYYFSNIVFFVGGIFMIFSLMTLAIQLPSESFSNSDLIILLANSIIYGLSQFAYAAFDKAFIGLMSEAILLGISVIFVFKVKAKFREYPYVLSSLVSFLVGTMATIIVRMVLKI